MNPLRFIFLGTGTSGGVPVIACGCAACTSSDPRDTRTRQGAAIQWIDPEGMPRTVLIDTTPDLRQQALRHGLTRCDAILFTHHHVDHVFGLDEVRRFNIVMRAPIPIYAERDTLGHLARIYQHVFDPRANENNSFVATLETNVLAPAHAIELFGLRVTPFRLFHGNLPILGFRIDAEHETLAHPDVLPLAYCTDTSRIPDESRAHLAGLRNLALDALRPRPHPTHFHLDEAIREARTIGATNTYFVHIAHEILHEPTDSSLPAGINLAHDSLVLGDDRMPDVLREPGETTDTRLIED